MRKRFVSMPGTSILKRMAAVFLALLLALPASALPVSASTTYTVTVAKGYLALRSAKAYDASNEIGQLTTGETVEVTDTNGTYWTVYSARLNKTGYVNRAYLANSSSTRTVVVNSGYLALRSAKAYDSSNEVGKLYTGDTVQIANSKDSTYWLVYAPGLGKGGYVNKNYLSGNTSGTSGTSYTVSVSSGYLALRSAKAYDSSNEIGELYSGDTVQAIDTSGSTYWYVYSPKYGTYGYVNKNYLYGATASYPTRTVSVSSGYLALRSARAYDESNEIGKLYSGETVQVRDSSTGTYWLVYSPKLGKTGYVNSNYLY